MENHRWFADVIDSLDRLCFDFSYCLAPNESCLYRDILPSGFGILDGCGQLFCPGRWTSWFRRSSEEGWRRFLFRGGLGGMVSTTFPRCERRFPDTV
jgi:hypothetical protein